MGRLSDLFSVNCCFITIVILGIALAIPILWPGPNQSIINACQKKEYRKIHTLVAEALEQINTERRHQAKLKGEAFIKANVDDIDFGSGRHSMHVAAMHGDVPILKYFHQQHGGSIHLPMPEPDGRYPLHFAAAFGTPETVKLLLDWGADVNARAQAGWTPLLKAVLLSNHDIVELLLQRGADPNLHVERSFNSVQCAIMYSDERMIFLLLKHGGYVEEGESRYDDYVQHRDTVLRMGLLKEEDLYQRAFQYQRQQTNADQTNDDSPSISRDAASFNRPDEMDELEAAGFE